MAPQFFARLVVEFVNFGKLVRQIGVFQMLLLLLLGIGFVSLTIILLLVNTGIRLIGYEIDLNTCNYTRTYLFHIIPIIIILKKI